MPGTASGTTASPRTSPAAPAAAGGITVAKTDSQAATPPINLDAYKACLAVPPSIPPQDIVTQLAGWSDVSKMGEAEAPGFPRPASASGIPPAGGFISNSTTADGIPYNCSRALVSLDYQGQREFPPVRATFTAFGFEPVTATAFLIQDGAIPFTAVNYIDISAPFGSAGKSTGAVATATVRLRLADVTVNGTPVNVGGDCRTTGPLTSPGNPVDPNMLVLAGGNQPGDPMPYYNLTAGGALAGEADIPAFTGCVTPSGENLDGLLDATVSGPGNYIRMQQGPACTSAVGAPPVSSSTCTGTGASVPGTLWTVTGGGPYASTGTTPLTFTTGNPTSAAGGVIFQCPDSQIAGTIPDAAGPPRGAQLTLGWTRISDCTGTSQKKSLGQIVSSPYGTWTVTVTSTPKPSLNAYRSGTVSGTAFGVTVKLTGTNLPGTPSACSLQASGGPGLTYSDSSSQLTIGGGFFGGSTPIVASDCTASGTITGRTLVIGPVTYTLNRHVQITSP